MRRLLTAFAAVAVFGVGFTVAELRPEAQESYVARGFRVDDVIRNADGSISVPFTSGPLPLPAEPAGSSYEFPSLEVMRQQLEGMERGINIDDLGLLMVAAADRRDPSGVASFRYVIGKTLELDLTVVRPIRIR